MAAMLGPIGFVAGHTRLFVARISPAVEGIGTFSMRGTAASGVDIRFWPWPHPLPAVWARR
jgi:hypothetical protein